MSSRVFSVVLLAITLAGCSSGGGNPNSPSPIEVTKLVAYEVPPVEHAAVNDAGQPTSMWATLREIYPGPGTIVSSLSAGCPIRCAKFNLDLGFKDLGNPNLVATFHLGWSYDGQTIAVALPDLMYKSGQTMPYNREFLEIPMPPPSHLLVLASHPSADPIPGKGGSRIEAESGKYAFATGWK